jgi:hypothetical protein
MKSILEPSTQEVLAGLVERVTFHNAANGFCVLRTKARGQGSEFLAVIIPVLTQHYPMLQRNLLYTGVTRGKRLAVIVAQKEATAIAVRNVSGLRRWSKLDEWLRLGASRTSFDASKARCGRF